MNVTILCGHLDSRYARDVLRALNERGLSRVDVVAAEEQGVSSSWRVLWERHGWNLPLVAVDRVVRRLMCGAKKIWRHAPASVSSLETEVKGQGGRFIRVRNLNGETCRQALQELQVDVMILAGTPIIRAPILAIPRLGVLNAHQGALPRFRGMNVIEWAVLERAQPMLSVHFVDPGVDTGDIIMTTPIPLFAGDTLREVRLRASAQQPELLAQTAAALASGSLPRRSQQAEEGRQYFVMHPRLRLIAEQRLQEYLQESSRKKIQSLDGKDVNDTNQHAHPVLVKCAG